MPKKVVKKSIKTSTTNKPEVKKDVVKQTTKEITTLKTKITKPVSRAYGSTKKFFQKWPLFLFILFLALIYIFIVISSALRKPQPEVTETVVEPKQVETYSLKKTPYITLNGKVEKTGIIQVFAQAPGIVQKVNFPEGTSVKKGQSLIALSTSYQGGNSASVGRQIAEVSAKSLNDNYSIQKEVIAKQRDLANLADQQSDDLREISKKSIDETKQSITLSDDIISSIDKNIAYLESTNVAGSNDAAILGAKQSKSGALGGLNQLKSALRNTEYQTDGSKPGAKVSDITKEIALKQLELQERSLDIAKDIAYLNVKMARISESLMYPAAPFGGVVEKVYVRAGQMVNPGTLLATIVASESENILKVQTTAPIARSILATEPSMITIKGQTIALLPSHISSEATDGMLHSLSYVLPEESAWLTNTEYIAVRVPVGPEKIIVNDPFVPLDALYQTAQNAYVYVVAEDENGMYAKAKEVTIGEVSGEYVAVWAGVGTEDVVIVSRTILEGDRIVPIEQNSELN